MGKLTTPDWILKSGKKPAKKKAKSSFKIRKCPKCGSDKVSIVLGAVEGNRKGEWECKKCKWTGTNISIEEVSEDEFMKYLDEKGEELG